MTSDATQSFVDNLLDRSSGLASGAKPVIASYYSPEDDARDTLLEETTKEQITTPDAIGPHEQETPVRYDQQEQARHAESTVFQPPSQENTPDSAPTLMSRNVDFPKPSSFSNETAQTEIASTKEHSNQNNSTTHSTIERVVSAPSDPVQIMEQTETPIQRQQTTEDSPQDINTQLASAIARLTSIQSPPPNNRPVEDTTIMPLERRDIPDPPQIPEMESRQSKTQPTPELHIHIGEIVVEADSAQETSQAASHTPKPKWSPRLTLDDYREARRRGQR